MVKSLSGCRQERINPRHSARCNHGRSTSLEGRKFIAENSRCRNHSGKPTAKKKFGPVVRRRYQRMTAESKLEVLRAVQGAGLPVKQVLSQLGIARATYYRWRRSFRQRGQPGLHDRPPIHGRTWNQILPEERDKILEVALLFPDWSPRQASCHITDTAGFSVSESSVYRILKYEGLIHEVQQKTFPAGAEYRVKTSRPNQQW